MDQQVKWLEERRKGIGGSDIAAILGLSPFKTPLQVYQDKRKEVRAWSGSPQTDWGKRMEPVIRQWYSDTTGRAVRLPGGDGYGIMFATDYPFMLATLDGFTDDGRIVEIKTARHGKGWGEPGTNEIPDYYAVQCHHQMIVSGMEVADVPVSICGSSPELYTIEKDVEIREMIIEAAAKFWERVVAGNPPEPITKEDAVLLYGRSEKTGNVMAGMDDMANVIELKSVKGQIKELEGKEEVLQGKLMAAIGATGDTLISSAGDILATWKLAKGRTSFDSKKFASDHPDLSKQYTKQGDPSRRFLLK